MIATISELADRGQNVRELTEDQQFVSQWFSELLDMGYSCTDAVNFMVKNRGIAFHVLLDADFRNWLLN